MTTQKTTDRDEAREELRQRAEGAVLESIGAALVYLESDDAADLIRRAGLKGQRSEKVLRDLTGISV